MAEIVKDIAKGLPWYMYVALTVTSVLMIASFCLPPTGKIDPSVLKGTGIILAAVWLYNFSVNLPAYIEAGASARIKHGETEVSISGRPSNDNYGTETDTEI